MEQVFVLVQRNLNGEVNVQTEKDVVAAICKQKAMLVGCDPMMIRATIKEEEINAVIANLEKVGRDRLANDEEEVTIVFFSKRVSVR